MTTTVPASPTLRLGLPARGSAWAMALPALMLVIFSVLQFQVLRTGSKDN